VYTGFSNTLWDFYYGSKYSIIIYQEKLNDISFR